MTLTFKNPKFKPFYIFIIILTFFLFFPSFSVKADVVFPESIPDYSLVDDAYDFYDDYLIMNVRKKSGSTWYNIYMLYLYNGSFTRVNGGNYYNGNIQNCITYVCSASNTTDWTFSTVDNFINILYLTSGYSSTNPSYTILYTSKDIYYENGTLSDSANLYYDDPTIQEPEPTEPPSTLDNISSFLSGGLTGLLNDIVDGITGLVSSIADGFSDLRNALINKLIEIWDVISGIPDAVIDGLSTLLQFLFVPEDGFFTDVVDEFKGHFGFIFQFLEIYDSITDVYAYADDGTPVFNITLYGHTMTIIDFSFYAPYRTFIQSIMVAIAWYNFIMWLLHNLPGVLNVGGALVQYEVKSNGR